MKCYRLPVGIFLTIENGILEQVAKTFFGQKQFDRDLMNLVFKSNQKSNIYLKARYQLIISR